MKNTNKALTFITVIAIIGLMILPLTGCEEAGSDLQRITVSTPPAKTSYIIDEDLNTAGMVVTAIYSDGSRSAVSGYSVSGFDSETAGVKTVKVTYQGKTAPFSVTVFSKVVARPVATPVDGTYFASQSVTLSTTTEGASIRYTLDGSIPTASSALYSGAISVSAVTTLKAIAVKDGWADSGILTLGYYFTKMTVDTWTDGSLLVSNSEQWFKFTASANPQFIHLKSGSLSSVTVQLYEADGTTIFGDEGVISADNSISRTVTVGKEYNIKVTNASDGTFKLGFTSSSTAPTTTSFPTSGVTTLTADAWANGSILSTQNSQWFKFTATGTTQYIYLFDAASSVTVQLYKADGTTSGVSASLSNGYSLSRTSLTVGDVYYIEVRPNTTVPPRTYKIAFSDSSTTPEITLPTTGVNTLTAGIWADGNITTTGGNQWFKFTATAETQYIHFQTSGTLTDVYVQLYKADGTTAGTNVNLYGNTLYTSQTVTVNDVYYIRVRPYNNTDRGTYKIAFAASATVAITVPATTTTLSANAWANGSITAGGDQWFKFTATTTTVTDIKYYLHFEPGTIDDVYIQLFSATGVYVGNQTNLYQSNYSSYSSPTISSGNVYYIRVWSYNSGVGGTYKLAFNTSPTAPN
jgi:hypothetical protein